LSDPANADVHYVYKGSFWNPTFMVPACPG